MFGDFKRSQVFNRHLAMSNLTSLGAKTVGPD